MRRLASLLFAATLLVGGCAAQASVEASPEQVLSFTATTVDGTAFDGASLEGKPTVLWFWAPWCPTCRNQIGAVSDLATTYEGKVNVVGVGSLDEPTAIADFADDVPADFPELTDPDGEVWKHFGVTAQSTYVVLDADHEVVKTGYLSDDELAATVADLAG